MMKRLRYSVPIWAMRRFVSRYEWLYRLASWMRGNDQLARGDEDIVLDGFPRSANSWAEAALVVSQAKTGGLKMAHHCHAAAQLKAGARLGLPTLVLVRSPHEAVTSYREMLTEPVPTAQLYRDYIDLYEPLLVLFDQLCFCSFSEVTNDFAAVMRRMNARFGTKFEIPKHDAAFVAAVRAEMDQISIRRTGSPTRYSRARGEEFAKQREARTLIIAHELEADRDSPDARAAQLLYERLKAMMVEHEPAYQSAQRS